MRALVIFSVFSLVLLFPACKKDLVDTSQNNVEDINSNQTFEEKLAEGTVLVFFHASWCHKCEEQRPAFESASKDPDLSFAEFYEVEYEENKEIVDQYNIPGFPVMVIFKDGEEKERFIGTGHSKEKIATQLKLYE